MRGAQETHAEQECKVFGRRAFQCMEGGRSKLSSAGDECRWSESDKPSLKNTWDRNNDRRRYAIQVTTNPIFLWLGALDIDYAR